MSTGTRLLSRAIWKAHGHKCAYCGRFFDDPAHQTVDHVIPLAILNREQKKAQLFTELGLDENYDLNALDNLLPADTTCNFRKADNIRDP